MELFDRLLTITDPVTAVGLFAFAWVAFNLKSLVVTGPNGFSLKAMFKTDKNEEPNS